MSWFTKEDEQAFNNNEFDSMASAIILINQDDKVLLNLRDDIPDILYPGYWSIIGGGIESGETPTQAIIREVKEEISYDIEYPELVTKTVDSNEIVYVFVKHLNAIRGDFVLNEGCDLRFFDKSELKDLKITPFLKNVLLEYFRRN